MKDQVVNRPGPQRKGLQLLVAMASWFVSEGHLDVSALGAGV
jgi:hypothetical protein